MEPFTRRSFLADVGGGMLSAGLGAALALELDLAPAQAGEEPPPLHFGDLEPLVALLQETPPEKLLPQVVAKLSAGTALKTLTAAAVLANARTFGGENYYGFHVFMALAPAYQMAAELPTARAALPLLKVLYRNAHYLREVGGRSHEVLHAGVVPAGTVLPDSLRKAVNAGDRATAFVRDAQHQRLRRPGTDCMNCSFSFDYPDLQQSRFLTKRGRVGCAAGRQHACHSATPWELHFLEDETIIRFRSERVRRGPTVPLR